MATQVDRLKGLTMHKEVGPAQDPKKHGDTSGSCNINHKLVDFIEPFRIGQEMTTRNGLPVYLSKHTTTVISVGPII